MADNGKAQKGKESPVKKTTPSKPKMKKQVRDNLSSSEFAFTQEATKVNKETPPKTTKDDDKVKQEATKKEDNEYEVTYSAQFHFRQYTIKSRWTAFARLSAYTP